MKKLKILTVLLIPLLLSCTYNIGKPTKTQLLTGMYQVYNSQHEDYLKMAANPAITEAQKQTLRKKKPILDSLGTLIPIFDRSIQTGTDTLEQQQLIMDLINSLESL